MLQCKLSFRSGNPATGSCISSGCSLGSKCFRFARLLYICLPRCTCTRSSNLHCWAVIQTSNADTGTTALWPNFSGNCWSFSRSLAAFSGNNTIPLLNLLALCFIEAFNYFYSGKKVQASFFFYKTKIQYWNWSCGWIELNWKLIVSDREMSDRTTGDLLA